MTVKANLNTGLALRDVHYWGNAIGESGGSSDDAWVNVMDVLGARDNVHGRFNPATIFDEYDFNRDSQVNVTDVLIARHNPTGRFDSLKLILAPPG